MLADASSSNEAVHLQQRLKSLSTELVTLRNRLHVSGSGNNPFTNFPASNLNILSGKVVSYLFKIHKLINLKNI
jgi:hypothetical protein